MPELTRLGAVGTDEIGSLHRDLLEGFGTLLQRHALGCSDREGRQGIQRLVPALEREANLDSPH